MTKRRKRRPAVGKKISPARLHLFIDALSKCANVAESCRLSNVSRTAVYKAKGDDLSFSMAWEGALEDACDGFEMELTNRAIDGQEIPIMSRGKQAVMADGSPAFAKKPSDRLILALLKKWRPNEWGDSRKYTIEGNITHEVKDGGAMVSITLNDVKALPPEERRQLGNIMDQIETNRVSGIGDYPVQYAYIPITNDEGEPING